MNQILNYIGNTPLYHYKDTNIYIKLEKFNASGSIKDRTVMGLLLDAFNKQLINKETTIVEASSGNTGISLAMLGASYQIPVIIIMPSSMSKERRDLIKAYGATLLLTDASKGMSGAIEKQKELLVSHSNYISLEQFNNPANIDIHYQTTGKEIIEQLPDIDIFTCGVGTGGSFSGIAKALKEYNPNIQTIAIEPNSSPILSKGKAGSHSIQGIGAGFIPNNLLLEYVEEVRTVTNEEAQYCAVSFSKETGNLVGLSSGANICIAKQLAKQFPDKKIVTLAPDGLEKYLSIVGETNA